MLVWVRFLRFEIIRRASSDSRDNDIEELSLKLEVEDCGVARAGGGVGTFSMGFEIVVWFCEEGYF